MPQYVVEYAVGDTSYVDVITALTPAGASATIQEWIPTAYICDVREKAK